MAPRYNQETVYLRALLPRGLEEVWVSASTEERYSNDQIPLSSLHATRYWEE